MIRIHLKQLISENIVVKLENKDEVRYLFKICPLYSTFCLHHIPIYFTSFNDESYAVYPYDLSMNSLSDEDFILYQNDVRTKIISLYPTIYKIYEWLAYENVISMAL